MMSASDNTTPSNIHHHSVFGGGGRALVWLNILVQFLFPLACTFTPVMAAAPVQHRVLFQPSDATQVYTLKPGESVQDVARQFSISLDALRKLNQFRTFAHGFDHLRAGDEVDVPAGKSPASSLNNPGRDALQKNSAPAGSPASSSQGGDPVQEWQNKMAGTLSSIGTALSSHSKSQSEGDVFANMAVNMAASQASAEVENWMRGFGNARIQLNPDRHLSLRNAQADLLFPLWETPTALLFTQGSLHRTDDRLQTNLGLGWRYFAGTWMAGANTFFDYDYTGGHARSGLGLEYWRDDLKLSTNAYFRLSGWKDSRALDDYEERPADGWDVRAEAWLPAYPQLGGKLTWEQYYGHEVGMNGASERLEDPHRLTAGLSWTPVPLMTLTAERTLGGGGGNDARVGVEFRWQPGSTLSRQLDSNAVAYMRSLAGSRYDFVSRNNDIILEYRKKQVVFLSLPEQLSGRGGATVALHASVRAEHGLDHITWQSGAFSTAGGKIDDLGGGDFQLTLPPYNGADSQQNTWSLSAVATDSKGNTSSPAQTRVTVIPGQLSATRSTFTPAESDLPADGHTTRMLTLALVDDSGQPVDFSTDSITLMRENLSGSPAAASLSPLNRQSPGVYVVTVTAGTQSGTFRLTPGVSGQSLPPATVHVAGALAPGQSSVSATPDVLTANGRETAIIRFVARDAQGEAVEGLQDLSFSLDAVAAPNVTPGDPTQVYTLTPVVSEGGGIYTATLTGRQAGKVTIRPLVGGRPVGNLSTQVTFTSEATSGLLVAFTRDKNEAKASGDDEVHLVASVRDAQGNPVPNQTVLFSATDGAQLSSDFVTTDNNGDAEVTLTSTNTGESVVTASLSASRLTQAVRFVADNNSAQIPDGYLVVLRDNAAADGLDAARVGLLVTDKQYNPLPGVEVKLSGDNGLILSDGAPVTDKNGEIYVTLASTTAGTSNVVAEINGSRRTVPVHFVASRQTPIIVSVTADKDNVPSDGHTAISVEAVVTDVNGNILPDVTVGFSGSGDTRLSASTGLTNAQGSAKVDVRSATAGTFTITASIGGNHLGTDVHFVPDRSSAQIERGHLVVLANNQPAGSSDRVGVLVTDTGHNPVPGVAVKLSAEGGAAVTPAEATTDEQGEVYAAVSSFRAGPIRVTASLANGSNDNAEVMFTPDTTTAQVTELKVTGGDDAPADNRTPVRLQVTVRDQHNNPVANSRVSLSADTGITLSSPAGGVSTDDQGQVDFTALSSRAGAFTVRAKGESGAEKTQTVHFIADLVSLKVRALDADRSQPADGASAVMLTAQVRDSQGNVSPDGVHVHFTLPADVTAKDGKPEAVTAGGKAVLPVVSAVEGVYPVKAGVNAAGDEVGGTATFLTDVAHAGVALNGANVARVGLEVPLTAVVTDGSGRPVAGMAVAFTVTSGTARFAAGGKATGAPTDKEGRVTVSLKDTGAGDNHVTATLANGKTASMVVAFVKKVSPDLTAPVAVTMTYDADRAKSVATSDAVGEGNGGPLSVTAAPSGVVTATLTSDHRVKLTALKVPAGLVTITVSQAATPDTEAPKDVTFTVKVNKGAGGKNEERIPAVTAGNTVTLTMPLARTGSKITYVLTDAGTTGASLSGDKLKVLYPGTVTVTGTDALDGYDNLVTTIVVPVNKKTSPALTTPANVTMTYDADPAKSVATSDAVGEGNGAPLSVTAAPSGIVTATLTSDHRVKLTALRVPTGLVTITVSQAATPDTEAPKDVTFTVTVNKGTLPDLKPGNIDSLNVDETKADNSASQLKAKAGFVKDTVLTYKSGDETIATVDSDGNVKGVKAGSATITVTETLANYTEKKETFTVSVKDVIVVTLSHPGGAIASPGSLSWAYTALTATVMVNGKEAPDDDVTFTSTPGITISESSSHTDESFVQKSSGGKAVIHIASKSAGAFNLTASYRGAKSPSLPVTFGKFTPHLDKPAAISVDWPLTADITTPTGKGVGGAPGAGDFVASSDNPDVIESLDIRVNNDGTVSIDKGKVQKVGSANITVTTRETPDAVAAPAVTFPVTVNKGPLPDLKPGNIDLNVGATKDDNSANNLKKVTGFLTGTKLTFSSDKTAIATVDKDTGKVTGVSAGSATITVTETLANYANKTETFTVNVSDVIAVTLSHPGGAIASPGSLSWAYTALTATVMVNGKEAPDDDVTFTSTPGITISESSSHTDESFVQKSSGGKAVIHIASKSAGAFNLTASYRGAKSPSLPVTFGKFTPHLDKPAAISVDWPLTADITTPTGKGVGGAPGAGDFVASSDNPDVIESLDIRVNNDGTVSIDKGKVQKVGSANITVTTRETPDAVAAPAVTFPVTVNKGPLPDLKPGHIDLNVGATKDDNSADNLKKVKGFLTGTKLTFSSDKTAIATVDKDTGKVTGVSAGSATITVTETLANYANKTETFTVNVNDVKPEIILHFPRTVRLDGHFGYEAVVHWKGHEGQRVSVKRSLESDGGVWANGGQQIGKSWQDTVFTTASSLHDMARIHDDQVEIVDDGRSSATYVKMCFTIDSQGECATVTVIDPKKDGVTLSLSPETISEGETATLEAVVMEGGHPAANEKVTFNPGSTTGVRSSSGGWTGTTDSNGRTAINVTGVLAGYYSFTAATAGTKSSNTRELHVVAPVKIPALIKPNDIKEAYTGKIEKTSTSVCSNNSCAGGELTSSSSDTSVATIDHTDQSTGRVHINIKGPGTAVITVTRGSDSVTFNVTETLNLPQPHLHSPQHHDENGCGEVHWWGKEDAYATPLPSGTKMEITAYSGMGKGEDAKVYPAGDEKATCLREHSQFSLRFVFKDIKGPESFFENEFDGKILGNNDADWGKG
ncbi:Ig-like domain-containing protein [Cedecea sp. NFIX57]|uniref:Ig-like domain-containing protein n=1 Tax=Cedecea sp. NFIX57 TaxID=1566286 RepID=UPI000A09BFB7|nr:inverse autotransporter beta domain-containing protein [Cedecea sp. NFIX57]SMG61821.1 Uncharacterized conserved protein YjdB, contains Ig-like domain [Cedecea sp. NFIX57]